MLNRPYHDLDQSPLYRLSSRSKLARLLSVSLGELRNLSVGDELYREFDIPKKTGVGVRHVENPCKSLKQLQARLARRLCQICPPEFLFCPVKRKCYVTNAAKHIGNRVIQCLDIKKFYPSVPSRRVYWFFRNVMKCEKDISGLLTKLACYNGHLPTGSPLSPILAYFTYYDLWQRISEFCKQRGYTLTVYVDDITISGSKVPLSDIWEVRRMIHGVGLRYHKQKTYIDKPAEVTGVVVKGDRISAPHRQHKKLHEALVALKSEGRDDRQVLLGKVAGVRGQIRQISSKNSV